MIVHENGTFLLKNETLSCLLALNQWGQPELLHFGAPIQLEDARAMQLQPSCGWGTKVHLEESTAASCPDAMGLFWSGSGRGDYRESPAEFSLGAVNLRYVNHEIMEGGVSMKSTLPQAKKPTESLVLTFAGEGLEVKHIFSLFDTAMTRRTVVKNTGENSFEIGKIMSWMMDLPGSFEMTSFHGGWSCEMNREITPVTKSRIAFDSTTGFSSNRHNPGFLLSVPGATEESGCVYGFNLLYSGNHYASAQQSHQGLTRVMQGISPDHLAYPLAPGEEFETPEGVLCWSDAGFGGLSANMHTFVSRHVIPEYWQNRSRPVLYNSWEGCLFDFTQGSLLKLARKAKDLGCELFVLDDGWFGARNNDTAGLGDYTVNKKKLPGGISGLSRKIHALGMEFGLWFEPESVNPDSDLYRAHPDWALPGELLARHQLLLDLTKKEVRDYIVENVGRILDESDISYVKWDMNRHSPALGNKAHDYILGLYEVLDRIFTPRPQILLESCASGGNRFDLGMMSFSPQAWCSDDTDPIQRLTIQGGLSYLYPQSTFGTHVSAAPHAQTLRNTPLTTRGNVSFFGCLGYELDLNHLLDVEVKEIQAQIQLYKQYRSVFQFGQFRRIAQGWQVSQGNTTMAGVFYGCRPATPGYEQLRLVGLNKEKRYHFRTRPHSMRLAQVGALVKHVAPVALNPNGFILRTADRHFTLEDGIHEGTASGAAFLSGIPMLPAFRGTGYDKNQRTQLDYGSNLYIVEEVAP